MLVYTAVHKTRTIVLVNIFVHLMIVSLAIERVSSHEYAGDICKHPKCRGHLLKRKKNWDQRHSSVVGKKSSLARMSSAIRQNNRSVMRKRCRNTYDMEGTTCHKVVKHEPLVAGVPILAKCRKTKLRSRKFPLCSVDVVFSNP